MLQVKRRFWGSRPGFDMGDILHIMVNLGFVAVLYGMVVFWDLTLLAMVLVVLSKWRILAVQPRFWLPNIKANLVDMIVGISAVVLIDQAAHTWLAIAYGLLYVGWLLLLKPQDSDAWVGVQSLWAQFLGLTCLFMLPFMIRTPLLMTGLAWLVAWAAARHFFSNYEEPHYRTLGLVWGLLVSEMVWISLHWISYYVLFDTKIASLALLVTVLSGCLGSLYHAYKSNKLQRELVLENALFSIALVVIILATSSWKANL